MRKKRNLKPYNQVTEKLKDKILLHITQTGLPISKAAVKFKISVTTLNKIFDERYNKRANLIINQNQKDEKDENCTD